MFKIHVHNKTNIPLFYIVIQIMYISILLNQHKNLKYSIIGFFFKCVILFENYITLYCGH